MLWDASSSEPSAAAERTANALHLQLHSVRLEHPPYDFESDLRERSEMLLVLSSRFFAPHRSRIAELALQHRLPSMFIFSAYAKVGGLMSYGGDPIPPAAPRRFLCGQNFQRGETPGFTRRAGDYVRTGGKSQNCKSYRPRTCCLGVIAAYPTGLTGLATGPERPPLSSLTRRPPAASLIHARSDDGCAAGGTRLKPHPGRALVELCRIGPSNRALCPSTKFRQPWLGAPPGSANPHLTTQAKPATAAIKKKSGSLRAATNQAASRRIFDRSLIGHDAHQPVAL
jgi:hypothetical protein